MHHSCPIRHRKANVGLKYLKPGLWGFLARGKSLERKEFPKYVERSAHVVAHRSMKAR